MEVPDVPDGYAQNTENSWNHRRLISVGAYHDAVLTGTDLSTERISDLLTSIPLYRIGKEKLEISDLSR